MNFPKILTLSITMNSWSLVAALWHDTTSCLGISNAKSRSYNIHVYNRQIDVKVDRHLSSATAEVPIKFQSDTIYKLQILRLQGLAYYYRIKKSYWICKRAPENFSTSNNLYRRLYIYMYMIYIWLNDFWFSPVSHPFMWVGCFSILLFGCNLHGTGRCYTKPVLSVNTFSHGVSKFFFIVIAYPCIKWKTVWANLISMNGSQTIILTHWPMRDAAGILNW